MKGDPNGVSLQVYRRASTRQDTPIIYRDPHSNPYDWLRKFENYGLLFGGDVYFIQHETGGPIKIGTSTHVPSRLRSINADSHDPRYRLLASIPGAGRFYEKIFHSCYSHLRMHNEWFRPEQDLLRFISVVNDA